MVVPERSWLGAVEGATTVGAAAVVLFVVLALVVPTAQIADRRSTASSANLSRLSRAMAGYAADHDGAFPPDTSSPRQAWPYLKPYLFSTSVLLTRNPDSGEFLGNGSLACRDVFTLPYPGTALEFFESAPWPSGRRNMSLLDGRTDCLDEGDFQSAVGRGWWLRSASAP